MNTKDESVIELSASELAEVTGAGWTTDEINGLYNSMWDVWEGVKEGYDAAHPTTDIHYGGADGLPPPNA